MPDRAGAPPRAWQRMLSGRRLDLLDPSPLDVEISDIAHGLARVARWNGQTHGDHAYSVAQHSIAVETIYSLLSGGENAEWRLAALLHDAPEYVIGDMISPFKSVVGGGYKAVENRLHEAICRRFSMAVKLPEKQRKLIKRADVIAAWFEATELAGFTQAEAAKYFDRPNGITLEQIDLSPKPANTVQNQFLRSFDMLDRLRGGASVPR